MLSQGGFLEADFVYCLWFSQQWGSPLAKPQCRFLALSQSVYPSPTTFIQYLERLSILYCLSLTFASEVEHVRGLGELSVAFELCMQLHFCCSHRPCFLWFPHLDPDLWSWREAVNSQDQSSLLHTFLVCASYDQNVCEGVACMHLCLELISCALCSATCRGAPSSNCQFLCSS